MNFINLNVRSCYSLLGSTIEIDSLVEYAKVRNLKTLSLVEDGNMHSAVKFFTATKKAEIRAVIGVSLIVKQNNASCKWTLFARNNAGYQALLKLTSDYALAGALSAVAVLAQAENLVICINVLDVLAEFTFDATTNLYLGITSVRDLPQAQALQALNLPFVFLNEVRILNEEDLPVLKMLAAIKDNIKISQVKLDEAVHFLGNNEARRLSETTEFLATAMANTVNIAALCDVNLELGLNLLPKFQVPTGDEASAYLEALCLKGVKRRYGEAVLAIHYERLKYELKIINRMGFADYFLIVWDFIKFAKLKQILVGPGRGSAAGSLVAYVLGITGVDPIKYNLLFERFLNPERISLPDIDVDFQDDRRDEVIEYVQALYGEFAVCQIATFGTFATRSAWRDAARVHGLDSAQINAVTKHLTSERSLKQNLDANEALQNYLKAHPNQSAVYMKATHIEGFLRHVSTHAAGIIISPADLRNFTAVTKGATNIYLSQYEADDLQAIGLLKMDFLGLRNLTMIGEISASIKLEVDEQFDINQLPLDDLPTYELIKTANTAGIFQLESGGMRGALRQILPSHIEDIISALALFRPGPMANIEMFAARKHGRAPVIYDHPKIASILSNTYGVIVYQEQIMQIASTVAGYSLGEADILRRAISKKDGRVLENEGLKFIGRAQELGYDQSVAKKIFELILKFANYGFNRSHAASYALISYQMAYLKANYPQYFFVAVLNSEIGNSKKTATIIKEVRSRKIAVLPPSVNESAKGYLATAGKIRLGFLQVKHLGFEMAKKLIAERDQGEFTTFFDFVTRTSKFLNEKNLAVLIDVGAADEFGYLREVLHANVARILDFIKYDGGLFKTAFEIETPEKITKPSHLALMEREHELLGFYLQTHPMQLFAEEVRMHGWLVPSEIGANYLNYAKLIICAGFVNRLREIRDKNGNLMAFLELSDEAAQIDVTIFSSDYRFEHKNLLNKVIVLKGVTSPRNDRLSLNFSKLISVLR